MVGLFRNLLHERLLNQDFGYLLIDKGVRAFSSWLRADIQPVRSDGQTTADMNTVWAIFDFFFIGTRMNRTKAGIEDL